MRKWLINLIAYFFSLPGDIDIALWWNSKETKQSTTTTWKTEMKSFNGKLEKRLTIYEYLLNYCIVQTDGEKVWMWLTKGEGKKEGRQNRVAQDIWSLVHNQVSLARTSLLGSLENYITMRSKKYEVKFKFLLSFDFKQYSRVK